MGAWDDEPLGSARLELREGVLLLRPEDAVFDAMLAGWEKQQRGGRRLDQSTVDARKAVVRRLMGFTNDYPWRWSASDLDDWMADLVMQQRLARSTLLNYQGAIRLFCDYVTSPALPVGRRVPEALWYPPDPNLP